MDAGWERVATPFGGTVAALASARAAEGTVVTAATPVGAYRSLDGGRTWSPLGESGLALAQAEVVALSPGFARDGRAFVGARGGLYRTRDHGAHWQLVLRGARVLSLAYAASSASALVLIAGTEDDGVLVSRDGGDNWAGANAGLLDLTALALAASPDFTHDGTAFAATPTGLYRTRNGARAWRAVALEQDEVAVQCLAVSPTFAHDRLVLAGTETNGLLRSADAGQTWASVPDLAGRGITALAFSGGPPPLIVAATDAGLARSADSGRSWQLLGDDLGPVLCLVFIPDGDGETLLAGLPSRGLARSADAGRTWAPSDAGLHAGLLARLSLSPTFTQDQSLAAVDLQQGVCLSTDAGRTWSNRNADLHGAAVAEVAFSPAYAHDATLYAAADAGLFRSRDRASTWRLVAPGAPAPCRAFALAPTRAGPPLVVAAFADGQLLLSPDGGERWTPLPWPCEGHEAVAAACSPADHAHPTLFLATLGNSDVPVVVWRSTDGGATWQRWLDERGDLPVELLAPSADSRGGALFVRLGARLLRPRHDAQEVRGRSRRPLWRPVEPAPVTALAASPTYAHDRTLLVACARQVYVSRNGGETFAPWTVAPAPVVALALSPASTQDRLAFAATLGGAIWRRCYG